MANTTIDQLLNLTGATTAENDLFLIYDASANTEKQIAVSEVRTAIGLSPVVISVSSSNSALRVTQTGAGAALTVEDSTNPDATPFVVDASGRVGVGTASPQVSLHIAATTPEIRLQDTEFTDKFSTLRNDNGVSIIMTRNDTVGGSLFVQGFDGTTVTNLARFGPTSIQMYIANTEIARFNTNGHLGLGTTLPTHILDVNGNTIRIRTAQTPASATATGTQGQIAWDANYIYVCTATNTWKRAALSTW